jgi:oxygen-independent coproporphyrinogen III oxidase
MTNPLILAETTVPRYTSYPTAPHFSDAVTAATYAGWLRELPVASRLSLYLHVPFCENICLYCGCLTKAVRRRDPVDLYAARLAAEIDLLAAALPARTVAHLHWGGGTPSILGTQHIGELIERIAAKFDITAIREHAIELDPRRMSPGLVKMLARIGVNRASLGVQDFTPHVQNTIGRVQPFALVRDATALLRDAGIDRINMDMMYGLPRQSVDDVARSADLAAELRPQRVAMFGYAHVPWFRHHQKLIDEASLPGAAERLAQMSAAAERFLAHGYVAIGLDHFALPDDELALAQRDGRLHRNFQGYTTDQADALIGIGASSIGRLPQGFVQNAPDMGGYSRALDANQFPIVKGVAFSDDDRLRGAVIERLMCDLAVDLDDVVAHAPAVARPGDDFAAEIAALTGLAEAGMVAVEGRRLTVPAAGRPFVRLVAAAFDSYLARGRARHSVAV